MNFFKPTKTKIRTPWKSNPGPPLAEKEEWKARVRDALIELEPRFTPFPFGFSEIAGMYSMSEDEARVRYRHIELNLPHDDTTGVQITIFDDTVSGQCSLLARRSCCPRCLSPSLGVPTRP